MEKRISSEFSVFDWKMFFLLKKKKKGVGQKIHNVEEYNAQEGITPSVITKGEEGGIFPSAVLLY